MVRFIPAMNFSFWTIQFILSIVIDTMLYSNKIIDMCTKSFNCYYCCYYCWFRFFVVVVFILHVENKKRRNKPWLRQRNSYRKEESWKNNEEKNKAIHGLIQLQQFYMSFKVCQMREYNGVCVCVALQFDAISELCLCLYFLKTSYWLNCSLFRNVLSVRLGDGYDFSIVIYDIIQIMRVCENKFFT